MILQEQVHISVVSGLAFVCLFHKNVIYEANSCLSFISPDFDFEQGNPKYLSYF